MTRCPRCAHPSPALHVLIDDDGAHQMCGYCLTQLWAAVERVGNSIVCVVQTHTGMIIHSRTGVT